MGSYNPPVAGLLKLGRPDSKGDLDYLAFGISDEHVHDLIRMLNDNDLMSTEPEWHAQIHAWRALGQLRAPEGIEPLLDLLADNSIAESFSDSILEELPKTLALFGDAALTATTRRLNEISKHGQISQDYANVLCAVGVTHPELRREAIDQLCKILGSATENDNTANAFVVSDLTELKATEAWPAIEQAFSTGCVDENVCSDLDAVKFGLGLGPEPPPRRYAPLGDLPVPAWLTASLQGVRRPNAKQRFNERQRKKKLEKKQKKMGK